MKLFSIRNTMFASGAFRLWSLVLVLGVLIVLLQNSAFADSYSFKPDEDGVIYPSNMQIKHNESRNNEYRTPMAKGIKYRPFGNDIRNDPFNQTYEDWLEDIRKNTQMQSDIDKDYEGFVREIGPLLFSLGQNELTPDLKDLLENIPPDSLESVGNPFVPKGPIDIDREVVGADPFEDGVSEEENVLGEDIGFSIAVTIPGAKGEELISLAYDAMKSGQMEGAISLYSQVLEGEPNNKDALFGLATTYHRVGQFEDAREHYIQLLTIAPNDWPALNNLMILAGEEAPESALKELRELEIANPEFSPIPAQIALIYLRLNKPEDAIKYLTRAIILSPENLGYRYNLAVVLDHGGYKKQAVRLYTQLIEAARRGEQLPESLQTITDRMRFINSAPIAVR